MSFLESLTLTDCSSRYKKYSLNEILAILQMVQSGYHYKRIAELVGRKPSSIYQKILEKQTVINGIVQCRSILKHKYLDSHQYGSELVDDEMFFRRLYREYGESCPSNYHEDIKCRVFQWMEEFRVNKARA